MEVILLKHITDVGKRGQVVDVKSAPAHNYLLPEGAALVVIKTEKDQGSGSLVFKTVKGFETRTVVIKPERGKRVWCVEDPQTGSGRKSFGYEPIAFGHDPITSSDEQAANALPYVLKTLREALEAIRESYSDVTHRELAWQRFQGTTIGPLWTAVEDLENDPYRQQLADVLDAAVSKLEAFQLKESHLSSIDLTLSRLALETVTEEDVDACENEWQAAEVETVPVLREAFQEWLASSYSGIEDGG